MIDRALPWETKDGQDLGPVLRVFIDDYTGWPSFATIIHTTINHAGDRAHETFVALREATMGRGNVVVPYTLDKIGGAVSVDCAKDLSTAEEDDLFDYYGVPVDSIAPMVEHGVVELPADPPRQLSPH